MYNKHTIVGRLGQDPELTYVGDEGTAKCKLRVAAQTGYGDFERTDWFNVIVWGAQAESCNEFLQIGNKVLVEGANLTDEHEGKYYTYIKASRVLFL